MLQLTDSCLAQLSTNMPQLENLDLRGCKQVAAALLKEPIKFRPTCAFIFIIYFSLSLFQCFRLKLVVDKAKSGFKTLCSVFQLIQLFVTFHCCITIFNFFYLF